MQSVENSQGLRISSLDFLKGIVVVLMTLDHVRSFFHYSAFYFSPTNIAVTSSAIFMTRWITNICPTAFIFLAGVSAFLTKKKKTKGELSLYLVKRGFLLVFVDLTLITFASYFDIYFSNVTLSVLSVIGLSMVILSALLYLPTFFILVISLAIIFGHNLLDSIQVNNSIWWSLIHQPTSFFISKDFILSIEYALLPWVGVMALGYCFGSLYGVDFNHMRRRHILNISGAVSIVLFVFLRTLNQYGDPYHWKEYDTILQTGMSFLKVTKYPASLLYILVTLGVVFIILAHSDSIKGRVVNFFSVFGKVPFFYYVVHLYIIHILAAIYAEITGFGWQSMVLKQWVNSSKELQGYGVGLLGVGLVWVVVISIMYIFCCYYIKYKSKT